jgi:8-oxo-dGTP pyrophosphatase MutT (NUDIX family)
MKTWEMLQSREIISDRWLKLTADQCRLPNGQIIDPYYVIHEKDWVHIFALTDDGRLLVVRQFRYAANVECVELPGGVIDQGEEPLAAAQRELLEETGYTANTWRAIGRMYANAARQANSIHLFLASGLSKVAAQNLDETEEIEFEFATINGIHAMIEANEFSQALHIASFYRGLKELEQ